MIISLSAICLSSNYISPRNSLKTCCSSLVWFPNPLAAGSQMGILSTHHALKLFFFLFNSDFQMVQCNKQTDTLHSNKCRTDHSFLFFPFKARAYIQPTICNAPKNHISFYFDLWNWYRMSKEQLL